MRLLSSELLLWRDSRPATESTPPSIADIALTTRRAATQRIMGALELLALARKALQQFLAFAIGDEQDDVHPVSDNP